ncbi:hypothetical protein ACQKOF_00065 [Lysinibacillus sp. NPDC093190]|uniref:hypothetical protein n=1 Tax=Lysinibacillus sp. NPDC093190 TaxID=3390575 RepID=UPI003D03E73B
MKAVEVMKEYLKRVQIEGQDLSDMYADHGELKNFKGEIFTGKKEIQNFYMSPMPKGFKLTVHNIEGDDTECIATVSTSWDGLPKPVILEERLILENEKIKSLAMIPK